MSEPTLLDYPGLRYGYNMQANADADKYATTSAFTGATADADGTWKTLADLGITTGE